MENGFNYYFILNLREMNNFSGKPIFLFSTKSSKIYLTLVHQNIPYIIVHQKLTSYFLNFKNEYLSQYN